jgi:hypothetical protein
LTTARRLTAELVCTFALVFAGCGEMRVVGLPEELAEKLVAAA